MRRMLAVFLLSFVIAAPVARADEFSPAQRDEIVKILRNVLKTDPTILRDALAAYQADEQAREDAEAQSRLAAKQSALTGNAADPIAGNPHGDITLVEFYDPRCPYCRKMLPSIESMLQKDHGLRIVYKDIPVLGPASVLETRAILAAGLQGAYGRMQSSLMTNPAPPNLALIMETANSLGLNAGKLKTDMDSKAITDKINANMHLAQDLKVEGTPVFIVGTQIIPGAVDQPALEEAIATARKHS